MTDIPSGKLVLLRDLHKCRKGDTVRITGIWEVQEGFTGILSYEGIEVEVRMDYQADISLNGHLVQCIGEILEEPTFGILRINGRILRNVDMLDMELYEKVTDLVNKTLNQ
ncbi:hypothetical protein BCV72DRAFT_227389 [Rhizopus microsporus var. microsporus]|uniref:Replication factor A protein 3 n=1 Tax=Rhizopus microsporus var. microsporus TaxID=86635 RepID=A0A1X0R4Z9_RHIZD|nr:hypothetical protein BCV72DRAFT_227389 [Rhizopus microsporus var. microsporus]